MPIPNSNFFLMPQLQTFLIDKDSGLGMAGGTIYFWEDEARTVPKDVFIQAQQPNNTYLFTDIGSQVKLSSIGTTQYLGTDCNIYLYPFDANSELQTYFITVYNAAGVFQFSRENYPPGATGSISPSESFTPSGNVIFNPQFAAVLFDNINGAAINVTGSNTVTAIAPGWNVITTGTGSFTVNQIGLTDVGAPGLPAYALKITSSGLSGNVILSQTIANSPRFLEGGFISGTFIGESFDGSPHVLSMNYVPSFPGTPIEVATGTVNIGGFTPISGTVATPTPATNTDAPAPNGSGNVMVQIVIPANATVEISAIQLTSVLNGTIVASYIQESVPQQINDLFYYYLPLLSYKPVPSLLVGWDFPLNPAQFFGTSVPAQATGANTSYYAWDQTILFQTATSGITVQKPFTGQYLTLTAAVATTQMAIVQYLSGAQAMKVFMAARGGLSVNLEIGSSVTQNFTVSLWWTANASLPAMGSNASLVTGLGVNGYPTVVAGWNEITLDGFGNSTFSTNTNAQLQSQQFSGFVNSSAYITGTYFAIVIGTNAVTTGNSIFVESISLTPGLIPTIPAPQTADEVLRECQYYYEKSYPPATVVGTSPVYEGALSIFQTNTTAGVLPSTFQIQYKQTKRVDTATPVVYSPSAGTTGSVDISSYGATALITTAYPLLTYWANQSFGADNATYVPASITLLSTSGGTKTGVLALHYSIDARLGVV